MMAAPIARQDLIQDENTLLKAIAKIDDLIDNNGLELMKLSMYEELTQTEKDDAKSPSDLARHLKKHYDNPLDVQERLIYTFKILGHRHFGYRAARKLEKSLGSRCHPFDIIPSQLHCQVNRQKFLLCQYLVTACRLIPQDCWEGFIKQCAKRLGHNWHKYDTPCQVLIKLLQQSKLTCRNHVDFMEDALVKAGVSESIMEEYENICNKIECGDLSSRPASRSRSNSLTVNSLKRCKSTGNIVSTMRSMHAYHTGPDTFSQTLPRSPHNNYEHKLIDNRALTKATPIVTDRRLLQPPATIMNAFQPSQAADIEPLSQSPVPTTDTVSTHQSALAGHEQQEGVHDDHEEHQKQKREKRMESEITCTQICCMHISPMTCCCILVIVPLLLLACVLGAFFSYQYYEWTTPTILRCQENTSMVLAEVDHLFTYSVTVIEDTKHIGDFYREIEIYRLNSACDNLPTRDKVTTMTNFPSINGSTIYALPGSSINLNICGRTNHTFGELERLELVLLKETLQATAVDAIDFFHVGTDDEWECKESTFYLDEPGYYTITFLAPTHPAEFMINATYRIYEIDSEQLNEIAKARHTFYMDQDSHVFHLSGIAHSCLVAVIGDNPSTLKQNIHIQLKFSNQEKIVIILACVLGGLVITIAVLMTELWLTYLYKMYKD